MTTAEKTIYKKTVRFSSPANSSRNSIFQVVINLEIRPKVSAGNVRTVENKLLPTGTEYQEISFVGDIEQRINNRWVEHSVGQCEGTLEAFLLTGVITKESADSAVGLSRILELWRDWHLNDMRAGCVHQQAAGWKHCQGHYDPERKATCSHPINLPVDYERLARDLKNDGVALARPAGMLYQCVEDKLSVPCPTCGYKYGCEWLLEEVPPQVLTELKSI